MSVPVPENGTPEAPPIWPDPFSIPASDAEAARVLAITGKVHRQYSVRDSIWHIWDGKCHRPDLAAAMGRWLSDVTERMLDTITDWQDYADGASPLRWLSAPPFWKPMVLTQQNRDKAVEHLKAASKYWSGVRRSAGHTALMHMLQVEFGVPPEALDERHPRWLNIENGIVSLETGKLEEHSPDAGMTYCVPAWYWPTAVCPLFAKVLFHVAGDDKDVAAFLLRALGYTLVGDNPERLIFFLDGDTSSGKSLLLEIIREILGPVAADSSADLICHVSHGRNARVENSIRGKRLVTIEETRSSMHIDPGQVKRLTGQASITVDQHYAKERLFTKRTWTIWVATNKMPALTDPDGAMRERVVVIPTGSTIPRDLRDTRLAEKILRDERAGVLSMLISAAMDYHKSGLVIPLKVQAHTDRYFAQQNTVANFLADTALMDAASAGYPKKQIWDQYNEWARNDRVKLGRNEFYEQVSSQPGIRESSDGRRFEGLVWSDPAQAWSSSYGR